MRSANPTFIQKTLEKKAQGANAVELFFDEGVGRYWNGTGTITLDGKTFYGAGGAGQISANGESSNLSAQGRTLVLAGVSLDELAYLQTVAQNCRNRLAKEYLIMFDDAGNYLTHICSYMGRMDGMTIKEEADTCTVVLNLESHLLDLSRPRIKRYTQEQLSKDSPNDYGLAFINGIQNFVIPWGSSVVYAPYKNPDARGTYNL